jgi:DNA-binding IclR family transcriptional regulator
MGSDTQSGDSRSKALDVISVLDEGGATGVTEIAQQLSIAKSTAHYHLDTLREKGFVVREGTRYKLSMEFLKFGFRVRQRIPLFEAARTEIDKLGRKTGELVILSTEQRGLGVSLYKAGGSEALDVDAPIGRTATLHDRGLPQTTDQTITSRDELYEELDSIREDGVAFNREEHIEGINGVGVPILNAGGAVRGAVSIAGPTSRMRGATFTENYPYLLSKTRNVIELEIEHNS